VRELSETFDETVTLNKEVPSAGKPLPPMLVSDHLPPVPAKLVKKKFKKDGSLKWLNSSPTH